jgi:hypothetical protein
LNSTNPSKSKVVNTVTLGEQPVPARFLSYIVPVVKLKASLGNFYDHKHIFVSHYEIPVSQMTMNMFRLSKSQSQPSFPFTNYHQLNFYIFPEIAIRSVWLHKWVKSDEDGLVFPNIRIIPGDISIYSVRHNL